MEKMIGKTRLNLIQGDINSAGDCAIVNAANTGLLGGVVWTARFIVRVGQRFLKSVRRFVQNRENALPARQ
jgi:O-acetyl-ADP-ribose deacetylase (regulator of RNase III)